MLPAGRRGQPRAASLSRCGGERYKHLYTVSVRVHIYIHIYICVCVCVCIYIYVYIYNISPSPKLHTRPHRPFVCSACTGSRFTTPSIVAKCGGVVLRVVVCGVVLVLSCVVLFLLGVCMCDLSILSQQERRLKAESG